MSRASSDRINVRRRYWLDRSTGNTEHVITIWQGGRFIRILFDQARRVVDEVHDLCDARDVELWQAESATSEETP